MRRWIYIRLERMAEEVVISSMREASEVVEDAKVADVKSLFDTHVNEGKVVLVVEGADDREVYEKVTDASSVCIYVDCNCDKHIVILDALNGRYGNRLLAIKDADFDRLEGKQYQYSNILLTDTHDMEGMIVEECLSELRGEDAERCKNINLIDVYSELEDISFLKWFSYTNHYGINFSGVTINLDITAYFNACVTNTANAVSVSLGDMYVFKVAHQSVSEKELCNGHDILERIYVRAKAAKVGNFAKKQFFRRLRSAYPKDKFVNTSLYNDIRKWETDNGYVILAAA